MPKKPLGIMGLREILGREYGIEEPYGGPCKNDSLLSSSLHYKSPVVSHIKTPSFLTQLFPAKRGAERRAARFMLSSRAKRVCITQAS